MQCASGSTEHFVPERDLLLLFLLQCPYARNLTFSGKNQPVYRILFFAGSYISVHSGLVMEKSAASDMKRAPSCYSGYRSQNKEFPPPFEPPLCFICAQVEEREWDWKNRSGEAVGERRWRANERCCFSSVYVIRSECSFCVTPVLTHRLFHSLSVAEHHLQQHS